MKGALTKLTRRENQVLRGLVRGMALKQVASELGITFSTADTHRSAAYAKIGAHCVTDVAKYFMVNDIAMAETRAKTSGLSRRQVELLALVGRGLTCKQIAPLMNISYCTVKNYRKAAFHKLGFSSLFQTMRFAILLELAPMIQAFK